MLYFLLAYYLFTTANIGVNMFMKFIEKLIPVFISTLVILLSIKLLLSAITVLISIAALLISVVITVVFNEFD